MRVHPCKKRGRWATQTWKGRIVINKKMVQYRDWCNVFTWTISNFIQDERVRVTSNEIRRTDISEKVLAVQARCHPLHHDEVPSLVKGKRGCSTRWGVTLSRGQILTFYEASGRGKGTYQYRETLAVRTRSPLHHDEVSPCKGLDQSELACEEITDRPEGFLPDWMQSWIT